MTLLISTTEAADYLHTLIPHAHRSKQRPGRLTVSPRIDLPEGHWCFEVDDLTLAEACAIIVQVWHRCPAESGLEHRYPPVVEAYREAV